MALAGLLPVVPLVRVLPLDAPERADLQQRDRALEGDLRRVARRARPRRARSLASVRARHLGARCDARDGADRAVLGVGGAGGGRWAVHDAPGSVYLRLVSVPWALGFEPPEIDGARPGQREQSSARRADVALRRRRPGDGRRPPGMRPTCSPATGSRRAWSRCRGSATSTGPGWPRSRATPRSSRSTITTSPGGQGDAVLAALAAEAPEAAARCTRSASRAIPKSGENNEVLRAHGLDAEGIVAQVTPSSRSGLSSEEPYRDRQLGLVRELERSRRRGSATPAGRGRAAARRSRRTGGSRRGRSRPPRRARAAATCSSSVSAYVTTPPWSSSR